MKILIKLLHLLVCNETATSAQQLKSSGLMTKKGIFTFILLCIIFRNQDRRVRRLGTVSNARGLIQMRNPLEGRLQVIAEWFMIVMRIETSCDELQ